MIPPLALTGYERLEDGDTAPPGELNRRLPAQK